MDFLNFYGASLSHHDEDICQAAAYGVGIMAVSNPDLFKDFCMQAMPVLLAVLKGHAQKHRYQQACENILSALVKIFSAFNTAIDAHQLLALSLDAFIAALPLTQDDSEFAVSYTYLANLLATYQAHPLLKEKAPLLLKGILKSLAALELQKKQAILALLLPAVTASFFPLLPKDLLQKALLLSQDGGFLEAHEKAALARLQIL